MKTLKALQQNANDEGFTLIELLIVMSIMLILMTLAMPQAMKMYKQAHETSAVQSLKAIGGAEASYASAYPSNGFANTIVALGGDPKSGAPSATSAQMLDNGLSTGFKSGYIFTVTGTSKTNVNNQDMYNGFEVTAVPASVGKSGDRGFCMDENNVVKFDPAGGTNCTQPLQ